MTKTVYEWAVEAVTASSEDILDINHALNLDFYSADQLRLAINGEQWMSADDEPELMFYRLALTKKVYEGPDEYDDLLHMDYAYVNGDGEFDEFDDAGGLPPVKYRKELATNMGKI
jgi:hypothetical protein